jgi:hypothetical protein
VNGSTSLRAAGAYDRAGIAGSWIGGVVVPPAVVHKTNTALTVTATTTLTTASARR